MTVLWPGVRGPFGKIAVLYIAAGVFLTSAVAIDTDTLSQYIEGEPSTLVLLQMLFRHGDRSPMESYPNNTNDALWPQGFAQLTKVGMQQAYDYGKKLRERYLSFLPAQYERSQVYVRSTDVDRTLMTAQTLLTGLFPTSLADWPGVFQPVPIHTQMKEDDHLFAEAPCPRTNDLKRQWSNTGPAAAQNIPKYMNLLKALSRFTNVSTLDDLHQLSDTVFCETTHSDVMTRPSWLSDYVYKELMQFRNESIQFTMIAPGTPRLFGGPLLYEITKNMQNRANNTSLYKLFLFSGHDTNIIALCRAMGILEDLQPPYLTSIIVELYEQNQHFFIRTLFDNHTEQSPYVKTITGCAVMCPLDQFHDLLQNNMLPAADREAACALLQITTKDLLTFLAMVVTVLGLAMAVMSFAYCRSRQKRRKTTANLCYQQLLQDTADYGDTDDDEVVAASGS